MTATNTPAGSTGNFEFAALRWASNYRRALLREFSPFLAGQLLEIGAGIGQFTELLCQLGTLRGITAVEPDPEFCSEFRKRLPNVKLVEGTSVNLPAETACDALVTINVLEHIRQDEQELSRYARFLRKKGGVLCIFVPARHEIYAPLDQDFGHYRRYGRPELLRKLSAAGLQILRLDYFNLVGYFAWWFTFRLMGKRSFNESSVRFFDRIIFPLSYGIESRLFRPPLGQSLLGVAKAVPR